MKLFFDLLANKLNGVGFTVSKLSERDFDELLRISSSQKLLPIIAEPLLSLPETVISPVDKDKLKKLSMRLTALQTLHTQAFIEVYKALAEKKLLPCVVKGLVCRLTYPFPDCRTSSDEDILVDRDSVSLCTDELVRLGFVILNKDRDSYNVTLARNDGLQIDIHTTLFPPHGATARLNDAMGSLRDNMCTIDIDGASVCTLSPTYHLLYLLLHAFKHFIGSGFGIRQICDIAFYTRKYKESIDFSFVSEAVKSVRAGKFCSAVYDCAVRYLGFDIVEFADVMSFLPSGISSDKLVEDILSGGIYGGDLSRQHSANITLGAYSDMKNGNTVIRALFPDRKYMTAKYPYLEKKPFLLPVARLSRIASFVAENIGNGSKSTDALKIGRKRTELMKYLGITE